MTSGGDSPGLNACIRSVVRTAIYNGLSIVGIQHGFEGMINGNFIAMDEQSVGKVGKAHRRRNMNRPATIIMGKTAAERRSEHTAQAECRTEHPEGTRPFFRNSDVSNVGLRCRDCR